MSCIFTCGFCAEVLVLLATLLVALIFYMKRKFRFWNKLGVPYLEPSIPFGNMGNLMLGKKSFGGTLVHAYNQLKAQGVRYGGMYFFTRPMFIPIDPEVVKSIMQTDFDHFVDRGMYVNEQKDPLSAHLFSLNGTRWRNLRAKLTPTFTSGKMKQMFHTLVDCSADLSPLVEQSMNEPIDIKDIVGRYTTDVIGSCAFGIESNTLKNPDNPFRYYGNKCFNPKGLQAIKLFCTFAFPELMLKLNMSVSNKEVENFFMGVVKETVEYREKNNVKRKDFMNLLLQLKNQGNIEEDDEEAQEETRKEVEGEIHVEALSLNQIAAQSFLFYLAGFETSSTTLSFLLYELTQDVIVQEKLRQEVKVVLEKHNENVTYDAIMEMKFMDNVIHETLRLHPPVPLLNRICNTPYKIPGSDITLPVGTHVFIVNEGMQLDAEHFPNPTLFDPNRFTDEVKATRHPYTHLPFGEGPRHCIGLRFGMMQVKVALAVLLKNFKFTLNKKTNLPLKMKKNSFINAVEGEIWLNAQKV